MISKTSLTALLDVKQAANLLAVSTRTIRRLIARGELAQGIELANEAPQQRFTAARMEAYATFLLEGRSTVTAANYFGVLCIAVIAMFPSADWDWLRNMQKELRRQATPIFYGRA